MSPAEALAGATSKPADAFNLEDVGRVKVGYRANLLLVNGNPLEDIKHTRRIESVWKDGHRVDRDKMMSQVQQARFKQEQKHRSEVREISDFETGLESKFGSGWSVATDGDSKCKLTRIDDGANGTEHAMKISGTAREAANRYSGVWFAPGKTKFVTTDLSSHKTLSFWVKGEPGKHSVMLFSPKIRSGRSTKKFETTKEWQNIIVRLSEFGNSDGTGVSGFWFGSHEPGEFEFLLDEVRLLK